MDDRTWKKMSVNQKIAYLNDEIEKSRARWKYIYENGTQDPFWPDGVNMNLVRNHVIYYLHQMKDLDDEPVQMSLFDSMNGSGVTDVMSDPRVPPEVPDTFMAQERKCFYFEDPYHTKAVYKEEFENGSGYVSVS